MLPCRLTVYVVQTILNCKNSGIREVVIGPWKYLSLTCGANQLYAAIQSSGETMSVDGQLLMVKLSKLTHSKNTVFSLSLS